MAHKFSLIRKSEKIELETAPGVTKEITLVEMSGMQRDRYLIDMQSKFTLKDGRAVPAEGVDVAGMQAGLLALCLKDGDAYIKRSDIENWPATVISELHKLAEKINGLAVEAAEEIKN
jgi:hypothetical protein